MVQIRYKHTNVIARDWRAIARFYQDVFGCTVASSERDFTQAWLAKGTGVANATLQGVHLELPGFAEGGPTLEIFSYGEMVEDPKQSVANKHGFGHIAFEVDDIPAMIARVLDHGGSMIGELVEFQLGQQMLAFVYVADPEGNIIELQRYWDA